MKKRRWLRAFLVVISALLVLVLVVPLIIPIPSAGTLPPEQLADPDSQFVQVNGLSVHLKTAGQGGTPMILLHGFGASLFSWHAVMQSLSRHGLVIAYDRPAFGLTERPLKWKGVNPYSLDGNVDLLLGLMDHFHLQKAILVGNSAGGTLAMQFALVHPERVQALILVDPATGSYGLPSWIKFFASTPQARRLGTLYLRSITGSGLDTIRRAWHDPSKITQETWDGYEKLLKVDGWERGLWDFTLASSDPALAAHFGDFHLPILVITGDDDRIIPTAESVRLASQLPEAGLAVIPNAGHVPQEEQPEAFLDAVDTFLFNLPPQDVGLRLPTTRL